MGMRQNFASLLIVLFAAFSVASIAFLSGIARQNEALGQTAEMTQIVLSNGERLRTVLNRVEDPERFRKISTQIITGRTNMLSGVSDLSAILHSNIRYYSVGLLVCLIGLFITGIAMYLGLRSYSQPSSRADGRAAI